MRCQTCKEFLDLAGTKFCPSCGVQVAEPPADPLIGESVGGRYRVKYLVAEGGMGRVYAAEQAMGRTSRKVAIKVLLSEYSGRDHDMQRFSRECSTVSELEHPNTIKFFDFGETPLGDLYIAMEFLSGQSLAQVLKQGPLSVERVDLIVGQICGSLQEAHDRGIVHRDLKPDNIVITSPGGAPDFVKVLDFGIAKRTGGVDPKLTPLGVVLGSPPYMSPEQFTLQEVDPRSDIYSLAVVAYQMVSGRLPFQATDPIEWAALHMGAQPMPLDDGAVFVPSNMKTAIFRALSKDPAERPQSMRDFFSEFTLGTGTLPPGRAPSMLPVHASMLPRLAGSGSSERPAAYRSAPTELGSTADATPNPFLYAEGKSSEHPHQLLSAPPLRGEVTSAPALVAIPGGSEPPAISFHELSPAALSLRSISDTSVLQSSEASAMDPAPPTAPDPQPYGSSEESDAMGRSPKGTVVMAASEPPGAAAPQQDPPTAVRAVPAPARFEAPRAGAPGGPKLTMPDLLPPTVRDPSLLAAYVRGAGGSTRLWWIALALVIVGGIGGAIGWMVFYRPTPKKPRTTQTEATGPRPVTDAPPTPVGVPTTATPRIAPTIAPTAAPASSAEKLSPCQTAIFSAVSGKCDTAHRSYARCTEDSPYRASATRAMTGLCP